MERNDRTSYAARLAERGLTIKSFDGRTLKLTYKPAADPRFQEGKPVSGDELTTYAKSVLAPLQEKNGPYARLELIEVVDRF